MRPVREKGKGYSPETFPLSSAGLFDKITDQDLLYRIAIAIVQFAYDRHPDQRTAELLRLARRSRYEFDGKRKLVSYAKDDSGTACAAVLIGFKHRCLNAPIYFASGALARPPREAAEDALRNIERMISFYKEEDQAEVTDALVNLLMTKLPQ